MWMSLGNVFESMCTLSKDKTIESHKHSIHRSQLSLFGCYINVYRLSSNAYIYVSITYECILFANDMRDGEHIVNAMCMDVHR